jgi:hypothetical protein
MSWPNSKAGLWHQSDSPALVRSKGTKGQYSRVTAHFHGFWVPRSGMTTLSGSNKKSLTQRRKERKEKQKKCKPALFFFSFFVFFALFAPLRDALFVSAT